MRPLQYDSTFTARANSDLRAAIAAAAEREGASTSDWVRRSLASVAFGPMLPVRSPRTHHQPSQASR